MMGLMVSGSEQDFTLVRSYTRRAGRLLRQKLEAMVSPLHGGGQLASELQQALKRGDGLSRREVNGKGTLIRSERRRRYHGSDDSLQ